MAIKLKLENGDSILVEDSDTAMNSCKVANSCKVLQSVFGGTAIVKYDSTYVDDYDFDDMLFEISKDIDLAETYQDGENYVRIVSAEWVDPSAAWTLSNDFKCYVLDYLNQEGDPAVAFNIAEGNDRCWKMWEAIENKFQFSDFEEVVNDLIKEDGLEFVFGNGFSLYGLFCYAFREVVRDYLEELGLEY